MELNRCDRCHYILAIIGLLVSTESSYRVNDRRHRVVDSKVLGITNKFETVFFFSDTKGKMANVIYLKF